MNPDLALAAEVQAWLEARPPAADSLNAVMARGIEAALQVPPPALMSDGAGRVAAVLATAAIDRLEAALRLGDTRDAAPDLLAADALVTYACEAAADAGPGTLEALVREFGTSRLARLLPPETSES